LRNILAVSWARSKVNYIRPAENLVAVGDRQLQNAVYMKKNRCSKKKKKGRAT
jgi:hypothetical protein